MNKKGDYKYDVALALILGLLIVALVFYFLYAKYFTQEDIDWQTCSQSLMLRSGRISNPLKWAVQEEIPFKCKTEVVDINFKDKEKAGKLIAETMAQCWALYGEGKEKYYADNFFIIEYRCFHCARIHFTDDVRDYYKDDLKINLGYALGFEKLDEGRTYGEYIYGAKEGYTVARDAFIKKDYVKEGCTFPNFIDSRDGDLIVTFVYAIEQTTFPWSSSGRTLIPYHPAKCELACDKPIETIPA